MFENPTMNLGATQELKKTNKISPKEGASFEEKGTIKLKGKKIEDVAKT